MTTLLEKVPNVTEAAWRDISKVKDESLARVL